MNERFLNKIKEHFQEVYKDIFPQNTGQFERHFKDTIELKTSRDLLQLVCQVSKITKSSKILDLGCGFGTFAFVCRRNGYKAYGVDIAEFEIDFARKRVKTELPDCSSDEVYQLCSVESLPFKDKNFDVVTLWNLLEHVPDYRRVLKEADRVLKPSGFLFLISPNYLALREEAHYHLLWFPLLPKRLGKLYLKIRKRDPFFLMNNIFYITKPGVLKWLKKNNYRVIIPEIEKIKNPDLCKSKFKAKLLKMANLFKMGFLVKFALYLIYINPFGRGISISARRNNLLK